MSTGDLKKFPFDFMECVEITGKGGFLRVADSTFYTKKFTYHSASAGANGKIEYVGFTNPGNGISASAWAIQRITYDASGNSTDVAWAGGSIALNKMFDDRTTYQFS